MAVTATQPGIILPFEYLWSINATNYFNFYDGITHQLTSHEFGNDNFRFMMRLDYDNQFYEELLFLEIVRCEDTEREFDLQYKISTDRDTITNFRFSKFQVGQQMVVWRTASIFYDSISYSPKMIRCDINLLKPYIPMPLELPVKPQLKRLSDDLISLRKKPRFSDIVLVAGENEFLANKALLAARSPVFNAMFSHENVEENQSSRVVIPDISPEALEMMLNFIYSGEVSDIEEIASDLLEAADKYEIPSLIKECEEQMCEQMTIETVCKILSVADARCLTSLKQKAIRFINSNAKEVMATDDWKEVIKTNHNLMGQLYENIFK